VTLDAASGLDRCDCPDYHYRRRDCRHMRAVQAGIVKPAAPAPDRNPA